MNLCLIYLIIKLLPTLLLFYTLCTYLAKNILKIYENNYYKYCALPLQQLISIMRLIFNIISLLYY